MCQTLSVFPFRSILHTFPSANLANMDASSLPSGFWFWDERSQWTEEVSSGCCISDPTPPTSFCSTGSIPLLKQPSPPRSSFWVQVIPSSPVSSGLRVLTANYHCQPLGHYTFYVYYSKPLHRVTLQNSPPLPRVSVISVSCITNTHLICVVIIYLTKAARAYQNGGDSECKFSWIPIPLGRLAWIFCQSTVKSCQIPKSPKLWKDEWT